MLDEREERLTKKNSGTVSHVSSFKGRTGAFFTTSGEDSAHPGAGKVDKQEELLKICREVSGVAVPGEE